jgi:hypothetical protein
MTASRSRVLHGAFPRSEDERGLYHSICIASQTEETDVSRCCSRKRGRMERPHWPARLRLHRATSISLRHVRERRVEGMVEAREEVLALAREARSRWQLSRALANRPTRAPHARRCGARGCGSGASWLPSPRCTSRRKPLFVLGNLANASCRSAKSPSARAAGRIPRPVARFGMGKPRHFFRTSPRCWPRRKRASRRRAGSSGFADAAYERVKEQRARTDEAPRA